MRKLKRIFTNFIARFQKKKKQDKSSKKIMYHEIVIIILQISINYLSISIPLKILKLAIIKMNKLRKKIELFQKFFFLILRSLSEDRNI